MSNFITLNTTLLLLLFSIALSLFNAYEANVAFVTKEDQRFLRMYNLLVVQLKGHLRYLVNVESEQSGLCLMFGGINKFRSRHFPKSK